MLVQFFVRIYAYIYKNKYILYKPINWNVADHVSKSLFVKFFNHVSVTSPVSKSIDFETLYATYICERFEILNNFEF